MNFIIEPPSAAGERLRLGVGFAAIGAFFVAGLLRLCLGVRDGSYLAVVMAALAVFTVTLLACRERRAPSRPRRRERRDRPRSH